jgi:TolB-like protein/Tfp pilus assembly protein PilF
LHKSEALNKVSQFWQELKRRNVVRVVSVYAAAAFVILELVDIIAEPLRLPEWFLTAVIVFLSIGFIIAAILSWIYDLRPEGGLEKTGPVQPSKATQAPEFSNGWKIASYISFVVIAGLIILHIISPSVGKASENLDGSIAVLPFRNDSPDEEKMYFINGTMESILDNLCKIEDLRVPGRTSVEQYRDVSRPIPEIAEELRVSYILEGSGQKIGNRVLLTVQLIEAAGDRHLWSKQYDREISRVEDLIDIQGEIASLVATEIKGIISPEEKQQLNKVPTSSLTAYDYYQQGMQEMWNFTADAYNYIALENSGSLFKKALDYDDRFAQAHAELAKYYYEKFNLSGHFEAKYLDSLKHSADRALSLDEQLALANSMQGNYYFIQTELDRAREYFDRAQEINPNDYRIYLNQGRLTSIDNVAQSIFNLEKASTMLTGAERVIVLKQLGEVYSLAGFHPQVESIANELLVSEEDSLGYYMLMSEVYFLNFDHDKAIEVLMKAYSLDSTNTSILLRLVWHHMLAENFEEALIYARKWQEYRELSSYFDYNMMHRVAYVFWQNDLQEEAEYYFNLQKEYCERIIELDQIRTYSKWTYFDLAGVYAFLGDKEKAYENLRIYNQKESEVWPGMYTLIGKEDPLFDSIREESEFQQIASDIERKCKAEHERVREWLAEHDML